MAACVRAEQKRVVLWASPRSLSTVFVRCMNVLNDVLNVAVMHEIYTAACHLGPNRQIRIPPLVMPLVYEPRMTYKKAKKQYEAEYATKDLVFCKELAYTVSGKLDMLPEGYKHTFLIRHPAKVFMSFDKFLHKFPNKLMGLELSEILPKGLVFQEMFELMEHTRNTLGQKPVVIDADDLIEDPEGILQVYCEAIGVPFKPGMSSWGSKNDGLKDWTYSKKLMFVNRCLGQYDRAFSTDGLLEPTARQEIDVSCLPHKIKEKVEICMPFYEQMYQYRLRPRNTGSESLHNNEETCVESATGT